MTEIRKLGTIRWARNVPGRLLYAGPDGLWRISEGDAPGAHYAINLVDNLYARIWELEAQLDGKRRALTDPT